MYKKKHLLVIRSVCRNSGHQRDTPVIIMLLKGNSKYVYIPLKLSIRQIFRNTLCVLRQHHSTHWGPIQKKYNLTFKSWQKCLNWLSKLLFYKKKCIPQRQQIIMTILNKIWNYSLIILGSWKSSHPPWI